ncbi:MAG: diguanylate cyclase [Deltaproteobacteria bacterium]|nr:diguanylate cyclase [Deltaproteobacteria bacterium]MDA8157745.1 diguanylate cyclase [Deltaproteobacteria bacterium]
MNNKEARGAYSAFNKLLCPILAINDKYDVIFLNKTAEEVYKNNINRVNKSDADLLNAEGTVGKCYKISHGYDKPCFELGENCPLRELINNRDKNRAAVNHNHKGQFYKVEAYRDGGDGSLFLESHVNISEFISEINIVKKAKEDVELSKKRLKTFFDDLPVPSLIVNVESGLIIDANKKAVDFYGYSKEEFAHMTIAVINPFISIEETIDFRAKALKEGYNFAVFKHRLKNGRLRDVEANISGFVYDGKTYIQVIINDVTEKKAVEERLKESEELFRTLADNIPVGLDMHREKFIYVNPALQNMLGYTSDELKNMFFWEILAEEYKNEAKRAIKEGLDDISYKHYVTFKAIKKSGEELWAYIYGSSIKYKGEVVRIASFIDITEMVNLRNSIEQERNLFKILIENIYSGIALYGKDKFLYVNSALLNLFGLTKEEFLNKSVTNFFDIEENQLYSSNVSLFNVHHNSEFSSRFIYKYTDKTDNVRYIDLFRTAVAYGGKETGLAIFTDVTGQIFREQNILVEKDIYKELSEIDTLTQIYNRRAMDAKLTELLNLAKRYSRPLSLIMFDIDRFKNINDTFGHSTGDLILKELAAAAKEDLRNTDFFARYGGEEFIVIAPETPLKTAKELAERLRLKVQGHDFKIGRGVTISLGVASLTDNDDERGIVNRVDSALYKAKELGRNLVYSENFD